MFEIGPYPSVGTVSSSMRPGRLSRAMMGFHSLRHSRRFHNNVSIVRIDPIEGRKYSSLVDKDIPLVFLTRNDRHIILPFLKHYRRIGVTRFLCVDDQSIDGTREFLSKEKDVDLYTSNVRYSAALGGRYWRHLLFKNYGINRWYLNVDSDEFLLYYKCESICLDSFIKELSKRGIKRCPGPMLDAYGEGDVEAVEFHGDTMDPFGVAPLFDGDGYELKALGKALSLKGGVRRRLFKIDQQLMKYPLLFVDRSTAFAQIHKPIPYGENFWPISSVLFHFKIFSDFRKRVNATVLNGQHYRGAEQYKKLSIALQDQDMLNLSYPGSVRYENSDQLVKLGFIRQI